MRLNWYLLCFGWLDFWLDFQLSSCLTQIKSKSLWMWHAWKYDMLMMRAGPHYYKKKSNVFSSVSGKYQIATSYSSLSMSCNCVHFVIIKNLSWSFFQFQIWQDVNNWFSPLKINMSHSSLSHPSKKSEIYYKCLNQQDFERKYL